MPADPSAAAARIWAGLDEPWQEAFRQALGYLWPRFQELTEVTRQPEMS